MKNVLYEAVNISNNKLFFNSDAFSWEIGSEGGQRKQVL